MKHGWEYKKLGEVCKITCGFTPKSDELSNEGYFPYFKVADMNTIGNEVFLSATQSYLKKSNKYYSKDSIVFPKNGATIATNKKRILKQDSIVDLNTAVASFDNEIIETMFSYYWFMNVDFKDYMRGGELPTLDIKTLKSSIIPIPPFSIQQSIVSELDEINNLLSLKRKELETYDKLARSLFYEMFGDPVENEMGWEVKKLEEVCECITDGSHFSPKSFENGVYPMLSVKDMDSNGFNYTNCKYISSEDYQILLSNGCQPLINDVLVAKDGSYLKTAFVQKEDKKQAILSSIAIIRPKQNLIISEFLAAFFRTSEAKETVEKYYLTGTAIKRIILKGFRSFQVYFPPLPLQQLFAQRIEAIEEQKVYVKAAIEKLETLLAARMQYWFD